MSIIRRVFCAYRGNHASTSRVNTAFWNSRPCQVRLMSRHAAANSKSRFEWIVKFTRRWKSSKAAQVPVAPPKAALTDMKRLLALAGPEKYRLTGGVALLAISSGVTISVPFFIGRIIDMIFKSEAAAELSSLSDGQTVESAKQKFEEDSRHEKINAALEKLTSFCYTLVGVFVVGAVANFGRVYLMQTAGALVVNRLRSQVFASILRQEVAFFDKTRTGELVNRLSNDASLVGYATTMNISDGLRSIVSGIGGAGMMWYTSPSLSIIGFAIVPPVAMIAMLYGRFLRRLTKRVNDALADATQVAEERISGVRTVRAFCAEGLEERRYTTKISSVINLAYKDALARAGFFGAAGLSGNLIMLAILYKGGEYVASGQISIGDLSSFLLYALYVGTSINGLGGFYTELMRGLGASERLFELLDRKPLIPYSGGIYLTPSTFHGRIQFQNVTFAYPGRENVKVLDGVDLTVPAGSVTAIVGPSGSGKSTMAALLLRYYDAISGSVMIDGQDIRQLDVNCLRRNIGTVSQEPVLFSCSIKENIAYGAGDECAAVHMDKVVESAKQANAYDFIMRLPQGFDTVVGERGILLSGGQRQRIAIARALLKNPKILLMDEATSALDAESEHLVKQALDRLLLHSDRTVLVIAHRLSTIKNADQIAVLQDRKVVELGTYEKLLSISDGVFRKLVERQTDGGVIVGSSAKAEADVRAQI